MEALLQEVLSPQQKEIFKLHNMKKTTRQISEIMKITPEQVRTQLARIKKKNKALAELNVSVNNEIQDVYDEMTSRTGKKTLKEVQVLSRLQSMSVSGEAPQVSRYMKNKISPSTKPKWTTIKKGTAPRKSSTAPEHPIDKRRDEFRQIAGIYRKYMGGGYSLDEMADMEIVLRAYGYIVKTPYINKRNRRTLMIMRAQSHKLVVEMTLDEAKEFFAEGRTSAKVIETKVETTKKGNVVGTKVIVMDRSEAWNRNILGMQSLAGMAATYHSKKLDPDADINEMAKLESVLRVYGFISETPYSDKKIQPLLEKRKKAISEKNESWFK